MRYNPKVTRAPLLVAMLTLLAGCRWLVDYDVAPSHPDGVVADARQIDQRWPSDAADDGGSGDRGAGDVAPIDAGGQDSARDLALDLGDGPPPLDASLPPDLTLAPDIALTWTYPGLTVTAISAAKIGPLWDLTGCPLVLRFTVEMAQGIFVDGHNTFLQIGMTSSPGPNKTPSGKGGWINVIPAEADVAQPQKQDLDDKIALQAQAGESENAYDVKTSGTIEPTAFGTHQNHNIWFDRTGIDASTSSCAGVPPTSFCTKGRYVIELRYEKVSTSKGTMMATINGLEQGFNTGGTWKSVPDISPAGRSFQGTLQQLQLFIALEAPSISGSVKVKDVTIIGCQ